MLRFDDVLELKPQPVKKGEFVIDAMGPLDRSEEDMIELCAWIFQRGDHDAAATEMTTGHDHETAHGEHLEFSKDSHGRDRWTLPLRQVGDKPLEVGDAFGVAVAMMRMKKQKDQQRVIWWGHPVTLI